MKYNFISYILSDTKRKNKNRNIKIRKMTHAIPLRNPFRFAKDALQAPNISCVLSKHITYWDGGVSNVRVCIVGSSGICRPDVRELKAEDKKSHRTDREVSAAVSGRSITTRPNE